MRRTRMVGKVVEVKLPNMVRYLRVLVVITNHLYRIEMGM